jgi:antibiotic biosynthesis monooxygenase (ABM) superfamily enzyme
MIKGVFNFAPFIFLGTCMSVSLVFYVFLPYYI